MKLRKFCAKCGKSLNNESKINDNFLCDECASKSFIDYDIPSKATLRRCVSCGAYSLNINKQEYFWQYKPEVEKDADFLTNMLLKHFFLKFNKKNRVKSLISFDKDIDLLDNIDLLAIIMLKSGISQSIQKKELLISIRDISCTHCARKRGGMFDAIVQIRIQHPKDKKKLDGILSECYRIEQQENFKNLHNFISKLEYTTNGFDLKVSTNAMSRTLIAKLRKKFFFEFKISKKLMGVDQEKGSDLYRQSTLLRLIPVERGNSILFEKEEYYVKNITKNRIGLQKISGGKIKLINYSAFQNKKWIFLKENLKEN